MNLKSVTVSLWRTIHQLLVGTNDGTNSTPLQPLDLGVARVSRVIATFYSRLIASVAIAKTTNKAVFYALNFAACGGFCGGFDV